MVVPTRLATSFPPIPSALALTGALAAALAATAGSIPEPQSDDTTPRVEAKAVESSEIPWPMRLGMRVAALELRLPVVEKVVLVPDEATFLAEIARWSPTGRWPVLFEDDRYAPMFIARFAPRRVFRRDAVGPLPDSDAGRAALANQSIIRAFGGDPTRQSLREVFAAVSFTPPGLVLTDFGDPAWPAAVALAAGRGQVLETLEGSFGDPSTPLTPEALTRLRTGVAEALDRCGYPHDAAGDAIDAITICRTLATKADTDLPAGRRVDIPVAGLDATKDLAVSDLLGRDEQGERTAIVGQIFGSRERSVYAAMCSMFLPRDVVSLFNTYGAEGDWAVYGVAGLSTVLEQVGFETQVAEGRDAGLAGWVGVVAADPAPDVLIVNSSGEPARMSLTGGERGRPRDVEGLRRPLALHFIHSFSMADPGDPATLGGAWLESGVYAYVGAVSEPYLASFVPPRYLFERLVNRTPFLAAGRQFQGPFTPAWRIMTYGDPLMLALPSRVHRLPRIPPPGTELVPGIELRSTVKDSMRLAAEGDPAAMTQALRTLRLLGEVEIARRLWSAAGGGMRSRSVVEAALPVLVESGELETFAATWKRIGASDDRARALLWQALGPRLDEIDDREVLLLLQSNLRSPQAWIDLERLMPHLRRVLGDGIARRIAQRELDAATESEDRRELQRILGSLGTAGLDGGSDATTGESGPGAAPVAPPRFTP